MLKSKLITVIYIISSIVICFGIILFLYSDSYSAMQITPDITETAHVKLTPAQQALLRHINNIENPDYRRNLIFKRIEKLLEESYTSEQLQFADSAFVPKAGREYAPKDVIVTDGALILKRYADIPDGIQSERLKVLNTGSCLINSVPYFWGGKAAHKGWNRHWGQDVIVSGGSFIAQVATEGNQELRYANAEGTQVLIPYGLDCSGFVDWAYWTALNYRIGGSTRQQWSNSNEIAEDELLPGDLGFLCSPSDPAVNHVGMYVGTNRNGKKMWLHCSSTKGVTIGWVDFVYYRRPNIDVYYKDE